MHKCKCRNTGASMLLFYPCENLVWHIESNPLMSVQHFFSSIFNCNLVYLMTIQLCQREFITLRKKINICRTNRQKIQILRNVLSSQKNLIQINKNRASQKKKKIKIVLPQHPGSKKQEKMTTKSKLEKKL